MADDVVAVATPFNAPRAGTPYYLRDYRLRDARLEDEHLRLLNAAERLQRDSEALERAYQAARLQT